MPWCPKCKTEYREGIEVCADCGNPLVKSLNEEDLTKDACCLLYGEEMQVKMIEEHLIKEGFSSAFTMPKKADRKGDFQMQPGSVYELFVSPEEKEGAVKCAAEFMHSTSPKEDEVDVSSAGSRGTNRRGIVHEYKSTKERYSDMKSTGIMLICFGVAGLAFMLLVIFQVISLHFSTFGAIIAYSVMGAFFGTLLIYGIITLFGAKKLNATGDEETKQVDALNAWCEKNLKKEEIEANFPGDSDDETVYFARYEYMEEAIRKEFPDLKEDFLEYYIELMYGKYFES